MTLSPPRGRASGLTTSYGSACKRSGRFRLARTLGAALQGRPQRLLGSYADTTCTLKVRGTVQSPPLSPACFILGNVSMPQIDAAGAGPQDLAAIFLAQHSLLPQ